MLNHNEENEYLVLETAHWKTMLTADQKTYLGRCAVWLKRSCGDLAELTSEELLDFHELVKKLEHACRKAFNATMFNWTCLMNNAYRTVPPNPQVHWHFRPRYNQIVIFAGTEFHDKLFGSHYELHTDSRDIGSEIRSLIVEELKKHL